MQSPPHLQKEINESAQAVATRIQDVEDFPIPGVTFKDMGPLWRDPVVSKRAIGAMILMVEQAQGKPDCVVGIESRGFIFGPAMALHWDVPFVPFRKPGKLPGALNRVSYNLEYGSAALECQANALKSGMRVLFMMMFLPRVARLVQPCSWSSRVMRRPWLVLSSLSSMD